MATIANDWIGVLKNRVKSRTLSAGHLENSTTCVTHYLNDHPNQRWSKFTKDAVTKWVAAQDGWGPSTSRTRIGLLRQLSAYASESKGLRDNLAKIEKPAETTRDYYATPSDYRAIVEYVMGHNKPGRQFALFIAVLWHTGARPGELAGATIRHVKEGQIVLSEHKNARKQKTKRVIYLNTCAAIALAQAIDGRTSKDDLIFLDSRGNPLHKDSIRNRLARARDKSSLSSKLVAYSFRHGYAYRALGKGIEIATLATLMGTSVEQIMRTYGHLAENQALLADAANRV